jgi:mitochondrial import receptor subunit TOM22
LKSIITTIKRSQSQRLPPSTTPQSLFDIFQPPTPPSASEANLATHKKNSDSEISNDSDFDPSQETLGERISALRDIIPPTTRAWFWNKYQATNRVVKGVIFFAGRSMWSISVSALLIGVPFALCWAEEQQVIAMEQEARMREMGADVLTAGGGEGTTADIVGQHLGKEGGVEVKAAGL